MANDKNTPGATTTCCGATDTKATFNAMADLFTETLQNFQTSNQKMIEAWTKGFTADVNPFGTFAKRGVSLQNGLTDTTTRLMNETTKVAIDQLNNISQAWQRSFEAMLGVTTKGRKVDTMVEATRDIVTEAMNTTTRNTERLFRLGLDSAQNVTGLVDETVTAVTGAATKRAN